MNKIQEFLQAHRTEAWVVLAAVVVLALASLLFGTNP